ELRCGGLCQCRFHSLSMGLETGMDHDLALRVDLDLHRLISRSDRSLAHFEICCAVSGLLVVNGDTDADSATLLSCLRLLGALGFVVDRLTGQLHRFEIRARVDQQSVGSGERKLGDDISSPNLDWVEVDLS